MEVRVDAALLWLRAVVVGSLAVFLGVAGHATADGLLPGPGVLAVLTVVAVVLCVPVLARPASALRLVAVMVGGQAVVHVVLTLAAGHVGDPARAVPVRAATGGATLPEVAGRRVGSLQDAYDAGAGHAGQAPSLPGHLVGDLVAHAPMMLVHLLAAALVGLWVAAGERALWQLLAMTGRRLVLAVDLLLAPVPAGPRPRALVATVRTRPVAGVWRARPQPRRGPPLVLA